MSKIQVLQDLRARKRFWIKDCKLINHSFESSIPQWSQNIDDIFEVKAYEIYACISGYRTHTVILE